MPYSPFELVAVVEAKCEVGEGPVWDERTQALWFTDIQRAQLLRFDWASGELTRIDLPERLGSFGLTVDPGRLVCAFASGFAYFTPAWRECLWLEKTEPLYRGIRMNDGRVDRMGRFWAGSMVEKAELARGGTGSMYRLNPGDNPRSTWMFDGIAISNSTCFSLDGSKLYFADTPTREIRSYTISGDEVEVMGTFVEVKGSGLPDGSDIDAAGQLWNAEWGSGKVVAYDPSGLVHAELHLPVSQATCPAFGGPHLNHLFVTSARDGLSAAQLEQEPHAGDLFVFRTPYRGLPAPRFGVTQGGR